MTENENKVMSEEDIMKAFECCTALGNSCPQCPYFVFKFRGVHCKRQAYQNVVELFKRKNEEIKKLKTENEILQKNADEAFQNGLNECRALFVREIYEEIAQLICDNTYPGADKNGKAVMIWKAKTGYDAIKEFIKRMAGEG